MIGLPQIPISAPDLSGNERKYLNDCIDSGWISSIGPYVRRFEHDFAAYCGTKHGVSLNTGTAALHLALRAIDIAPGDEVIVPALTFASTANAVLYEHAVPVFADCAADSWNMDAEGIGELITSRTRAIMPVHLYGLPCDMDPILNVAREHGLAVIEDAAEAHGATYKGRRVGSIGRIGCFSFYGNKIITTGEGGLCVTDDSALYERMTMLRDHGMDKGRRYWHTEVGFNYRMTNLQAAVGCAQLERIDDFIAKKRWIREQYNQRLQELACILPGDTPNACSVFWLYTLLLPQDVQAQQRDELIDWLKQHGVESRLVFYPITAMPPYARYARSVPRAESIAARGITLPSHHGLSESDIDRVCSLLKEWLKRPRSLKHAR